MLRDATYDKNVKAWHEVADLKYTLKCDDELLLNSIQYMLHSRNATCDQIITFLELHHDWT